MDMACTKTETLDEQAVQDGVTYASLSDYDGTEPGWYTKTLKLVISPEEGIYEGGTDPVFKNVIFGESLNNSIGVPSREGFEFLGWYDTTGGNTKIFDETGNYVTGRYWDENGNWKYQSSYVNIQVFPHWRPEHFTIRKISYNFCKRGCCLSCVIA